MLRCLFILIVGCFAIVGVPAIAKGSTAEDSAEYKAFKGCIIGALVIRDDGVMDPIVLGREIIDGPCRLKHLLFLGHSAKDPELVELTAQLLAEEEVAPIVLRHREHVRVQSEEPAKKQVVAEAAGLRWSTTGIVVAIVVGSFLAGRALSRSDRLQPPLPPTEVRASPGGTSRHPSEMTPGVFATQVFARGLDFGLVAIIAALPISLMPDLGLIAPKFHGVDIASPLISQSVLWIAMLVYDTFWIYKIGSTPGKLAFGVKVESLDKGSSISLGAAFSRAWWFMFAGFSFLLWFPTAQIASAILYFFWRRRERPWDRSARTQVIVGPVGNVRYLLFLCLSLISIVAVIGVASVINVLNKQALTVENTRLEPSADR
jgi:hypothetical protein